jgi:hypothetical protein
MHRHHHHAFGVRFEVVAPATVLADIVPRLPREPAGFPSPAPAAASTVSWRTYEVRSAGSGWALHVGSDVIGTAASLDVVLERLRGDTEVWTAIASPHALFVHAGAVAVDGRALLLPGASGAGKTTLVGALLRAGASYLSDDYAVIDPEGRVWSYAKPLSVRTSTGRRTVGAEALGAPIVDGPCTAALLVDTHYLAGGTTTLTTRGRAAGVVALLRNAPGARVAVRRHLEILTRALHHADVLAGPRGDADVTATLLLERLARGAAVVT